MRVSPVNRNDTGALIRSEDQSVRSPAAASAGGTYVDERKDRQPIIRDDHGHASGWPITGLGSRLRFGCLVVLGLMTLGAQAEVVWRESLADPFDVFGFGNEANANSSAGTTAGSCSRIASDDGRYVVFASDASNLVRGDTNNAADVFLR